MRILLLKDIEGIGREGEVRDVPEKVARESLFPKHFAVPAPADLGGVLVASVDRTREAERELGEVQSLAAALAEYELTLSSATFALDASATEQAVKIAAALRAAGFAVQDEWVSMSEPIVDVGEHAVRLQLPHGLEAEVTLMVE